MSEPITDQGERTRREMQAKLDSGNAEVSRLSAALSLINIEYAIKEVAATLASHVKDDNTIQGALKDAVKELSSRVGSVSSSVNKEQLDGRYTLKEMVFGWLALCGAIGALVGFIGWYLSGGPKP